MTDAADRSTSDAASEPVAGTLSLSLSLAASVERVRELRDKATPGEWVAHGPDQLGGCMVAVRHPHRFVADTADLHPSSLADAAFIAAAGSLSWDSLAAALTEMAGVRAALERIATWNEDETPHAFARAALSPTPMPPMPPTPSVPTKEGTSDE